MEIPRSPVISRPWNYVYAVSQVVVLVALLPYHAVVYALWPRSRPRPSWTWQESVLVPAVRRFLALVDSAGFKISSRNVFDAPSKSDRKLRQSGLEFDFFDHGPVDNDLVQSTVIDDPDVPMRDQVGVFSWYRTDKDKLAPPPRGQLVGLFFHGGAFKHNCAHPKAHSTIMPQTLFEREHRFVAMHSVEFRLLPEFPFPAQLQDAVTVYVALLKRGVLARQIVLLGDSSGANIALSLARWIRETLEKGAAPLERTSTHHEKQVTWTLGDPLGLILFSPWINPAHSFLECQPRDYVRRTNSCDYIFEQGPFRHDLVHSLLGPTKPREFVLSPYLSPGRVGVPRHTFDRHVPCFVSYGTGERGQEECERLIEYLRRDGTRVEVTTTQDTPHDVLLLGFWNRAQREQIWTGALEFLQSLDSSSSSSSSSSSNV